MTLEKAERLIGREAEVLKELQKSVSHRAIAGTVQVHRQVDDAGRGQQQGRNAMR
jgi:hypothetical protein